MSRIAIYGGSFDPPTIGHMAVIRWLAQQYDRLDEVWVVPAAEHAFNKRMVPCALRTRMVLAMLLEAKQAKLWSGRQIRVVNRPETYTVEMVEALRVQHPEHQWIVVVGADILTEASKWHRWDDLCRLAEILVVNRKGYEGSNLGDFPQVSSTEVRTAVREGRSFAHMVTPAVRQVIEENRLYLDEGA